MPQQREEKLETWMLGFPLCSGRGRGDAWGGGAGNMNLARVEAESIWGAGRYMRSFCRAEVAVPLSS